MAAISQQEMAVGRSAFESLGWTTVERSSSANIEKHNFTLVIRALISSNFVLFGDGHFKGFTIGRVVLNRSNLLLSK